ncbi:MAG: hypothetical protein R3E82_20855 [Pseudomonadales bacterium]|nr:hypothetical protein [Pseudomonadales bacterium]
MIRSLGAFLLALLTAYIVGAAAATQAVMSALGQMGVDVSIADRLGATLHDQVSMFATYAPLLAVALTVGLLVAVLISRFLPGWRRVGCVLAGFVAVIAMHLIMRQVLDLTPVAAARSPAGLLLQGFAGALGGYVFWLAGSGRQREVESTAQQRGSL